VTGEETDDLLPMNPEGAEVDDSQVQHGCLSINVHVGQTPFYDTTSFNYDGDHITYIINYSPDCDDSETDTEGDDNNVKRIETFGKSWTGYSFYGSVCFHPEHIYYDFSSPTSDSSSSSSTKTPIPLSVYLAMIVFFTYTLYRKSKKLT